MNENYDTSKRRSYNERSRVETRRRFEERPYATLEENLRRTRSAEGVRGVQNPRKKVVRPSSASEKSRRATKRRKRKNAIMKYVMIFIAAFVAISILLCMPIFNIKSINITGNNMIETKQLNNQLGYLTGMNAFTSNKGSLVQKYCFNYESLENELMTNNGRIASVNVKYSLGGTLKVAIEEAEPIAVAEIDEKYFLVDRQWVVMEEFSDNPMKEKPKNKKNNKKENKKEKTSKSDETITYEEVKDLALITGLSREDLCNSRVDRTRAGIKSSLMDAAWEFTEAGDSPFKQKANRICGIEVDNLFVTYVLERGIKVKMGDFSNLNEEQIMYKAEFLDSILSELGSDSHGTVDMFSSEKPVFIPDKKK